MGHKGQHREHVGALSLAEWPQVPGPEQVAGTPNCPGACLHIQVPGFLVGGIQLSAGLSAPHSHLLYARDPST